MPHGKSGTTHHCPNKYLGNCRFKKSPGDNATYCREHQSYCKTHDWAYMKEEYCSSCYTECPLHNEIYQLTDACPTCKEEENAAADPNQCPSKSEGGCNWIAATGNCTEHQWKCFVHDQVLSQNEACLDCVGTVENTDVNYTDGW